MVQKTFDYQPDLELTWTEEMTRLQGHNRKILDRLISGPATNRELACVSLKYTSRVSDIRKLLRLTGWDIGCQVLGGGLTRYSLVRLSDATVLAGRS